MPSSCLLFNQPGTRRETNEAHLVPSTSSVLQVNQKRSHEACGIGENPPGSLFDNDESFGLLSQHEPRIKAMGFDEVVSQLADNSSSRKVWWEYSEAARLGIEEAAHSAGRQDTLQGFPQMMTRSHPGQTDLPGRLLQHWSNPVHELYRESTGLAQHQNMVA